MRVSFVGKWWSGKTTVSALFSTYTSKYIKTLLIDADINVHLPQLFLGDINKIGKKYISNPENTKDIKQYLIGDNILIKSLDMFRKTTPPSQGSNFVEITNSWDYILDKYGMNINENLNLLLVW
jgi:CO dehydrogenase maturation factor